MDEIANADKGGPTDTDRSWQPLPDCWVPGEGPSPSRCMIVGEAPGKKECEEGLPFVGPAGKCLIEELEAVGLHREEIYITNTVKIWPRKPTGGTRPPNSAEIKAAHRYFKNEIRHVAPQFILALGETAVKALTGFCPTVERARAIGWRPLAAEFRHNAQVLPTYHPSFIKNRPGGKKKIEDWRVDLARFATACK